MRFQQHTEDFLKKSQSKLLINENLPRFHVEALEKILSKNKVWLVNAYLCYKIVRKVYQNHKKIYGLLSNEMYVHKLYFQSLINKVNDKE